MIVSEHRNLANRSHRAQKSSASTRELKGPVRRNIFVN
jgi:hypothetical protein